MNAHQQALRSTYDPEYLNYTLGKLMIRRLRGDAEVAARARGEEFDLRAFRDDFMSHGAAGDVDRAADAGGCGVAAVREARRRCGSAGVSGNGAGSHHFQGDCP